MTNTGSNGIESIRNLDNLMASGFTDSQARALLEAMSQNVATKSDVEIAKLELKRDIKEVENKIEKVRADLSKDIEKVRADLAVKIEETKGELTYRMFYFFLATIAVLGSLMGWMKFFIPIAQS